MEINPSLATITAPEVLWNTQMETDTTTAHKHWPSENKQEIAKCWTVLVS